MVSHKNNRLADSALSNIFKSEVVIKTLKNGEPILFYSKDVAISRLIGRRIHVSGFKDLAAELKKYNLRLVVLLVTTKYTVYGPLLRDDDSFRVDPTLFLNQVEKSLKEANIPVVNLLKSFRERAQKDYRDNRYIYWRDDTHWNARGVELAAGEILKQNVLD